MRSMASASAALRALGSGQATPIVLLCRRLWLGVVNGLAFPCLFIATIKHELGALGQKAPLSELPLLLISFSRFVVGISWGAVTL